MEQVSREEIIKVYFEEGYTYEEIRQILNKNGHEISYRHLQRIIKDLGLMRKYITEDLPVIVAAIMTELQGSGSCLGYKTMWLRLKSQYGLQVYRQTVLDLLRVLDPEGIEFRAKYKLHRRVYRVPGPNFAWHLDGYDKLKPFGFSIHGCVDGFSRKVLWWELATTNNQPGVISYFFLKAVKKFGCVPSVVRSDHGTENSIIDNLQQAFRLNHNDALAGFRSFIKGKSTANQRVESTWGRMRRLCIEFWIKFFKDMKDNGYFKKSNRIQVECLRYCFGPLISIDLQLTKREWNRHNIRKQTGDVKTGKPNFLYYMPETFDARDCGFKVDEEHITNAFEAFAIEPKFCDPDFKNLVNVLFPEILPPANIEDASIQYMKILQEIEKFS